MKSHGQLNLPLTKEERVIQAGASRQTKIRLSNEFQIVRVARVQRVECVVNTGDIHSIEQIESFSKEFKVNAFCETEPTREPEIYSCL